VGTGDRKRTQTRSESLQALGQILLKKQAEQMPFGVGVGETSINVEAVGV